MSLPTRRSLALYGLPVVAAAALAACGGGGGGDAGQPSVSTTGTLRVSLTDAPACGFEQVNVSIERIRVNRNADANENSVGWTDLKIAPARRIDLLKLGNGVLEELGQLSDPPMTKDAVAGRIRRLLSMADRKAKQDGIPDTESAVTPDLLDDA